MGGMLRDLALIALGLNLALIGFSLVLDLNQLLYLGCLNLFLCALGITISDIVKDKEEGDE